MNLSTRYTQKNSDGETSIKIVKILIDVSIFLIIYGSFFIVNEGHVGIKKKFGEAVGQYNPGIHYKYPFIDSIEEMEVRTRKKAQIDISVATKEQLPAQADISVNWTIDKSEAIDIYRKYGGLNQFENRILAPVINSAAKNGLAKYKAEDIIQNRSVAVASMKASIVLAMQDYPITINSVQLEDVTFPKSFTDAIEEKLTASQDAIKEQHRLTQQKLQSQQTVQTAEANADAKKIEANAEAYRISTVAKAQANANDIISISLSPILVQQNQVEKWNGTVPNFVSGESGNKFLFNVDGLKK